MGNWLDEFRKKFTNATIGAAMADTPAVMTASGWRQDEDKNYVQDQQNNKGVKQLRDDLAIISESSPTNPMSAGISWTANNIISKVVPDAYFKYKKINKLFNNNIDYVTGNSNKNLIPWYYNNSSKENAIRLAVRRGDFNNELQLLRDNKLLNSEKALGSGRMVHQRNRINSYLLRPRNQSYNKNWFREGDRFYDTDVSKDILSVNKQAINWEDVPGHFDPKVKTTNTLNLKDPNLDAKIFTRSMTGDIIPFNHIININ